MTSNLPEESGQARTSSSWRFVPWALCAFAFGLAVATFLLFPPVATPKKDLPAYVAYAFDVSWSLLAAFVAALIVSNRPGNRIGWLLFGLGLIWGAAIFAEGYAQAAARTGGLPAGDAVDLLGDVLYLTTVALFGLLVLLFPDGRPLSPRWRPVVWFTALWPATLLVVAVALGRTNTGAQAVLAVLMVITFTLVVVSAFSRFARSSGVERQQLKWFAFATAVGFGGAFLGALFGHWGAVLTSLSLYAPLAGIAIAILRHRLYDIDVLISRTFVYGALTAILAGLYTAGIRFFNWVFAEVLGLSEDLPLVLTTLILATSFTPIKVRLEEIAKRRFLESDAASAATAAPPPSDADDAMRAEVRELAERLARVEVRLAGPVEADRSSEEA